MKILILSKETLEKIVVKGNEFIPEIWSSNKKCNIEMSKDEVVDQLKELIAVTESFMVGEYEDFFDKDKKALESAIEAIRTKDTENILAENIEVMRNQIKKVEANELIYSQERAETITKLSKEIRKCINMKNFIEVSSRHIEEESTC